MLGGHRVKWREDAEVCKADRRTRRRHAASHGEDAVNCDEEAWQLLGDKPRRAVTKTRRRRCGRSDLKDLLVSWGREREGPDGSGGTRRKEPVSAPSGRGQSDKAGKTREMGGRAPGVRRRAVIKGTRLDY